MDWYSSGNRCEPFDVILKTRGNKRGVGFGVVGGTDTPMDGKGVFVNPIVPGGFAAEDGRIQEGDEIVKLNGSPVSRMSHFDIIDALRKSNKQDLVLTIVRRNNHFPSASPTEEDKKLSKPVSFSDGSSEKLNRSSLFDLLSQQVSKNNNDRHASMATNCDEDDKLSATVVDGSDDVEKVVVNRLPGQSMGLEIDIKRSLGRDDPLHRVVISHVVPGSAADKAISSRGRIQAGDEILAINGTHLKSVTHSEALQIINEMPLRVEMLIRSEDKGRDLYGHRKDDYGKSMHPMKQNPEERQDSRSLIRGQLKNKKYQNTIIMEAVRDFEPKLSGTKSPRRFDEDGQEGSLMDVVVDASEEEEEEEEEDAADSAFYENPRMDPEDERASPLSSYVLQTRRPSFRHEGFELRKLAFKKRRQEELGVKVEPCVVGDRYYLKVVDIRPESFLAKQKLVQNGDLLVSYNGLMLKNAAKSRFESILRSRGVVLEDVCLEILREKKVRHRGMESIFNLQDLVETERSRYGIFHRSTPDIADGSDGEGALSSGFLPTEDSRTPSPTKSMRSTIKEKELHDSRLKCVSRDSGMIDGVSSDGRWAWVPGTESELDENSRADSPRSGAYFFVDHSLEDVEAEDVSLLHYSKLSVDRIEDSRSVMKTPEPRGILYKSHKSLKRHSSSLHRLRSFTSSPDISAHASRSGTLDYQEAAPKFWDTHDYPASSDPTLVEDLPRVAPIPMPRRRNTPTPAHQQQQQNSSNVLTIMPDARENKYSYLTIQSEKVDTSQFDGLADDAVVPILPSTSIDEEIKNDMNVKQKIDPLPEVKVINSPPPVEESYETIDTTRYLRYCDSIHATDRKFLQNFINSILQDPEKLKILPDVSSADRPFRVVLTRGALGLGMKLALTPIGGLVERIDLNGPVARSGKLKLGDFVIAINNTPMATITSNRALDSFLASIPPGPINIIACHDPQLLINRNKDFGSGTLPDTTPVTSYPMKIPKIVTSKAEKSKTKDEIELEFILTSQPTDLGLGHVTEVIGVNTPYTTVIYSEKREEYATLEGVQCFFKDDDLVERKLKFGKGLRPNQLGIPKSDSRDSFEDDILLDGTRCGFVSRVDTFKRKFTRMPDPTPVS